jgi:predicted RNase H-like HicB family nuclease
MRYLVVVEKTRSGYSAYSPDVPGCVATGKTRALVERRMKSAIRFHLAGLRADGVRRPRSRAYSTWLEVRA